MSIQFTQILKDELIKHKVKVVLPGQKRIRKLYLIQTEIESCALDDFIAFYKIKKTQESIMKLAGPAINKGKKLNTFGILLTADLKIVYVFNKMFAKFDEKTRQLTFKTVMETINDERTSCVVDSIIDTLKKNEGTVIIPQHHEDSFRRSRGFNGDVKIKYAVPDLSTP